MSKLKKVLPCIPIALIITGVTASAATESLHGWSTNDSDAIDKGDGAYEFSYEEYYYNGGGKVPTAGVAILEEDYNGDGVINGWDANLRWNNIASVDFNFTNVTTEYLAFFVSMSRINTYQEYEYRYTGLLNDEEVADYPMTNSFKSLGGVSLSDTPDGTGDFSYVGYRPEPVYLVADITDNTASATAYIGGAYYEVPVDNDNYNTQKIYIDGIGSTFGLQTDFINIYMSEGAASLNSVVFRDENGNAIETITGKELADYNGKFTNGSYITAEADEAEELNKLSVTDKVSAEIKNKLILQNDGNTYRFYKLVDEASIANKTEAYMYIKSSDNENVIKMTTNKCYKKLNSVAAPDGYYYFCFVITDAPQNVTFYGSDIIIK